MIINKIKFLHYIVVVTLVYILAPDNAMAAAVNVEGNKGETKDYILSEGEDGVYFMELKDPNAGFNTIMFKFNKRLDKVVIKPVTKVYRTVVPKYLAKRLFFVLRNLQEPLYFVNSTLQLNFHNSLTSVWRFAINSTVGILGAYDVAARLGAPPYNTNFEVFMDKIGFEVGDYLVLPIIGPTNTRGAVAYVADIFLNPLTYLFNSDQFLIYKGSQTIVSRNEYFEEINEVLYNNENSYNLTKSVYEQKLVRLK